MNRIEALIEEYRNFNLYFKKDMPHGLGGFISNNNIYVSANESLNPLYSILAEEIGYYEAAGGDNIDKSIAMIKKYELMGRKWSYPNLMPQKDLERFIKANETVHLYDLAEEFGIPDDVLDEAVQMYLAKGYI